jgi:hypothetical protein
VTTRLEDLPEFDHRQLGRHTQVPLRFLHAAVAEVRGEMRQKPLHVCLLAVPTDQSIHRRRVPKVVQPGSERPAGWALQAGLLSHAFEHQLRGLAGGGPFVAIGQKRGVRSARPRGSPSAMAEQHIDQVGANRHEPTLVELRFVNRHNRLAKVHVG